MKGLHCAEPYVAQQVAKELERRVKRCSVKRVLFAIFRIREVHGVTHADAARVLGVARHYAIPQVPFDPKALRWSRAFGLHALQQGLDCGKVGVVTERGGCRRVKLEGEEARCFQFRADWRPLYEELTKGGEVAAYYVSRHAGIAPGTFVRLARPGADPSLDTGERLLALRDMIDSGSLEGWGEMPEGRSTTARKGEPAFIGESREHPLVSLARSVNEAFAEFERGGDAEEDEDARTAGSVTG